MTQEEKDYVYGVFIDTFIWMDASDAESLFCELEKDIIRDIEETADKEFNDSDIRIAIRRTLFNRLGIES